MFFPSLIRRRRLPPPMRRIARLKLCRNGGNVWLTSVKGRAADEGPLVRESFASASRFAPACFEPNLSRLFCLRGSCHITLKFFPCACSIHVDHWCFPLFFSFFLFFSPYPDDAKSFGSACPMENHVQQQQHVGGRGGGEEKAAGGDDQRVPAGTLDSF